jgi:hypothetical protein
MKAFVASLFALVMLSSHAYADPGSSSLPPSAPTTTHQCSVISLDTRKAVMGRLSPQALGSFDGFWGLHSACWRSKDDPAIYAGAACRQKNLSCS